MCALVTGVQTSALPISHVKPVRHGCVEHVIAFGPRLVGCDAILGKCTIIFKVGRGRAVRPLVTRPQPSRRDTRQIVALFLQRRAHIVAKEGEAGFGTELVADLSVDAREGRIGRRRSEEHTSELQSLMRISSAVFCLTKKNYNTLTQVVKDHKYNN